MKLEYQADKLLLSVVTPVLVNGKPYKALWDTGSSRTSISDKIVNEFNLKPIGRHKTETANGMITGNIYRIYLSLLPNHTICLEASDWYIPNENYDVIIGMDLITPGKLSICNNNGKTNFSFILDI